MKFDSAIGLDRPVRLSQATRTFAWESLNARYGKEALENGSVPLDGIPGVAGMAPLDQYDLAIREIAQKAPSASAPGSCSPARPPWAGPSSTTSPRPSMGSASSTASAT